MWEGILRVQRFGTIKVCKTLPFLDLNSENKFEKSF